MFSKVKIASLLLGLALTGSQATVLAENSDAKKPDLAGYFVTFEGSARSVSQAKLNGSNILSAPIVRLTLPVNVSGYLRPGANELALDYISNPKEAMTVLIEKRTVGPKKEEVAKVVLAANQSNGSVAKKSISFNLPKEEKTTAIENLNDDDKKAITQELQNYWNALSERKADKLRAIYKDSLDDERKLCPESAAFFDKILNREASLLRNPNIKLAPLDASGLIFKVEGDTVKVTREDKKPLLSSNEVDVEIEPVMVEVQSKAKSKTGPKTTMKQQIVRSSLYFKQNSQDGAKEWSVSLPPNA